MDQATQTMIDNLQKNTGKSLNEWISIVKASGIEKHGEIIKHLKTDQGLTHGYANLVAHKAKESEAGSAEDPQQLIAEQYKGKEILYPIYEKLLDKVKQFGPDVEFIPKKTYVSIKAKKQFALIQPSTKTRLDVGINLKGKEPEGKLEKSGSFNAMCSHRVRTETPDDVTPELIAWLEEAYLQSR
ncbi:DUF4287 domain-containing protein [Pontibacter sp. H249]|uniref:DUF4287 domain-containing protein n=1 Tax=Pontibacter sp. H249 TaxID=3133420 RepID=UPI0030BE99A6